MKMFFVRFKNNPNPYTYGAGYVARAAFPNGWMLQTAICLLMAYKRQTLVHFTIQSKTNRNSLFNVGITHIQSIA